MKKLLIIFLILFANLQVLADDIINKKVKANTSDQLKTLQDLYEAGKLSGYEYEKEKEKILNK
tara:strand:- start:309 stop:497 length:189 start_codon:yes stop_codon:yes gene_type:complete